MFATKDRAEPDAMLEHRIRQRAYEIYHARVKDANLQDWLQAEREVLDEITRFREAAAAPREVKITLGKAAG